MCVFGVPGLFKAATTEGTALLQRIVGSVFVSEARKQEERAKHARSRREAGREERGGETNETRIGLGAV